MSTMNTMNTVSARKPALAVCLRWEIGPDTTKETKKVWKKVMGSGEEEKNFP